MSVMVTITFPMASDEADRIVGENPHLLGAVRPLLEKHGGRFLFRLLGDGEFTDYDEYPSREAYAAFKAEAQPAIDAFEAALGVSSTDEVRDVVRLG
ncbi:hypothetical protein [Actinomadura rubrisoli]|uniref:Antibiotic biosynthesis monooxygenase n=1 Tax=Actinomadura rubrisoli TaxID=2530368 RepID=A0A4R5CDF5_9ACTN|nr:hypothetical protein [Actinomadura rubrisoli]TDD96330.1 hypothetical protein E1298_03410 [Actinomadura rubrisoli]